MNQYRVCPVAHTKCSYQNTAIALSPTADQGRIAERRSRGSHKSIPVIAGCVPGEHRRSVWRRRPGDRRQPARRACAAGGQHQSVGGPAPVGQSVRRYVWKCGAGSGDARRCGDNGGRRTAGQQWTVVDEER